MDKERKGKPEAQDTPTARAEAEIRELAKAGERGSVWIREDGAVCFGNECAVIKPGKDDTLDLEIKPDRCGREAGGLLLDYLIKTAGAGVTIRIPPRESGGLGEEK
jgi:hypothetical protein